MRSDEPGVQPLSHCSKQLPKFFAFVRFDQVKLAHYLRGEGFLELNSRTITLVTCSFMALNLLEHFIRSLQ